MNYLKIHFGSILLSISWSCKLQLPFRFLQWNFSKNRNARKRSRNTQSCLSHTFHLCTQTFALAVYDMKLLPFSHYGSLDGQSAILKHHKEFERLYSIVCLKPRGYWKLDFHHTKIKLYIKLEGQNFNSHTSPLSRYQIPYFIVTCKY
jgi:hypothetical protein